MKTIRHGDKRRGINSHALVIAVISFILALLVSEIIMLVFSYFNDKNGIVDDLGLGVMLFVIPSIAVVAMCVAIYINHMVLQTANTLNDAFARVSDGDYSVKIPYTKINSFNAVYENFNKMTAELKSVKALREDFVHEFSHEFKTPIASINGFANLLLEGGLTDEERAQTLKIIADESARLSRLSETVLTLSKLESQQFIGESNTFRLDVQLRDCIVLLQREWEGKGISIDTRLSPVKYKGDENLLRQVWLNLISNAVKFTPAGGKVTVSLTTEGGRARVDVSDTGIGIPEEEQEKISGQQGRRQWPRAGHLPPHMQHLRRKDIRKEPPGRGLYFYGHSVTGRPSWTHGRAICAGQSPFIQNRQVIEWRGGATRRAA